MNGLLTSAEDAEAMSDRYAKYEGHTPGPWRGHDMEENTIVARRPGEAVALVYGRSLTEEENAANFRLVRDAPAMLAENRRLREALEKIAAFDDQFASARLERTGSYSLFDEPGSVAAARAALQGDTP